MTVTDGSGPHNPEQPNPPQEMNTAQIEDLATTERHLRIALDDERALIQEDPTNKLAKTVGGAVAATVLVATGAFAAFRGPEGESTNTDAEQFPIAEGAAEDTLTEDLPAPEDTVVDVDSSTNAGLETSPYVDLSPEAIELEDAFGIAQWVNDNIELAINDADRELLAAMHAGEGPRFQRERDFMDSLSEETGLRDYSSMYTNGREREYFVESATLTDRSNSSFTISYRFLDNITNEVFAATEVFTKSSGDWQIERTINNSIGDIFDCPDMVSCDLGS